MSGRQPPHRTGRHISFDRTLFDAIAVVAADMSLSPSTLIEATMAGALRAGSVTHLVEQGMNTPALVGRRNKGRHGDAGRRGEWPSIEDGHRKNGPWELVRLGRTGGRYQRPDDGWYLTGPGAVDPVFLGARVDEAVASAQAIVDRYEAARTASEAPVSPVAALHAHQGAEMAEGPFTTATGRVLTDADIEALADEAEAGYVIDSETGRLVPDADSEQEYRREAESHWP